MILVSFENESSKEFKLKVTVPPNSMAKIYLPRLANKFSVLVGEKLVGGTIEGNYVTLDNIGSGEHLFVIAGVDD